MKRTGLKNRKLPDYTRGEEIFNMGYRILWAAHSGLSHWCCA